MLILLSYIWFGIFKFSVSCVIPAYHPSNPIIIYCLSLITFISFMGSFKLLILDGLLRYGSIPISQLLVIFLSCVCFGAIYGKVIKSIENKPIKLVKGLRIILMQFILSIPFYLIMIGLMFSIAGV